MTDDDKIKPIDYGKQHGVPDDLQPRFLAGVNMIERTGAKSFRIGYNDEDTPVVWFAVAEWEKITAGPTVHRAAECAAGLDPLSAVMRLCEQVIDGGLCMHCGQPTIFDPSPPTEGPVSRDVFNDVLDTIGCRYTFDPELATFRRSCEGDAD